MRIVRTALWLSAALIVVLWFTRFGTRWPAIYYMTGPSMEPTLEAGAYFFVWRTGQELRRGDLVLFRYQDEDGLFHVLRRLTALPGDTIAMDSGAVILNGERPDWPYQIMVLEASRSDLAIVSDLYDWGPWLVPPDSAVLLSDTRDMVGWPDSRFLGFIALDDIVGRADRTLGGRSLRPDAPEQ